MFLLYTICSCICVFVALWSDCDYAPFSPNPTHACLPRRCNAQPVQLAELATRVSCSPWKRTCLYLVCVRPMTCNLRSKMIRDKGLQTKHHLSGPVNGIYFYRFHSWRKTYSVYPLIQFWRLKFSQTRHFSEGVVLHMLMSPTFELDVCRSASSIFSSQVRVFQCSLLMDHCPKAMEI